MKTVAIFDNDESICETIERLVTRMGFDCVSAGTLVEAAFEIGKSQPEIIIADYEFKHGLNISFLAKTLQEKAQKVIILTASDPTEIKKRHPELRFATFITKGSSLRQIRNIIECDTH